MQARYPYIKVNVNEAPSTKFVRQCCHIEGFFFFFFAYLPSSATGLQVTQLPGLTINSVDPTAATKFHDLCIMLSDPMVKLHSQPTSKLTVIFSDLPSPELNLLGNDKLVR